jgi:hypothetical protein
MRWFAASKSHRFTSMKGADVNTTGRTRNRLMTVMLPALVMAYVAIPLAAIRK